MKTHSVLADQVGNPNRVLDANELNLPQGKRLRLFAAPPSPIAPFGFAPAAGNCENKSFSPSACVVANMDNDFWLIANRCGLHRQFDT